ncbi:hypothetical protein ACFL0W_00190 [Nanoarchaeota archaeon]
MKKTRITAKMELITMGKRVENWARERLKGFMMIESKQKVFGGLITLKSRYFGVAG